MRQSDPPRSPEETTIQGEPSVLRPLFYVIGTLLGTQAAVIATAVYLHRRLGHRALRLHPLADWAFRFGLSFTTCQHLPEWVSVHRKHHAFSDTANDPHSPP